MAIKAKFSVDNSELKKGLKDAENQAQSSMKKIADTAQDASGGFKGILGSLGKLGPYGKLAAVGIGAIAGAVTAVIAGVHKLAGKLDHIGKASKGVNLTTTAFQSLSHASKRCGVDMEFVQKILTKIQFHLAQADKGTKDVVDGFAALGISWSELQKLAPEQQLLAVIQAAEKIQDVSMRNKVLFKLFDKKDIQSLNKLIDADYGRLVANAKNMGVVIDEDAIRLAEAYNDSIGLASERIITMVANWKATKDVMKGIKEMAEEATKSLNPTDGKVADQFKAVYIGIGDAADELEKRLKENDNAEYQRIQKKIKELAKLKAIQATLQASGGRTIITDSMAEKMSSAYMNEARNEVMFREVSYRDSRFDPNDKNTWTQKRNSPLSQSVFDKEKIKADQVTAAVQRITKELEKKKKKHEEQLRSYNKEIDIKKEIAQIEAETGGKLTDSQKADVAKSLLEYQVARNKDIVGLIEQQTSKMNDEFEIQKALLDGDIKRAEILKTILKLKEHGITVSEVDFKNNEQIAASLDKQIAIAKKRQSELAGAKKESDEAQTTVAQTTAQMKSNSAKMKSNLDRQKSQEGTFSANEGEIKKYEQARMSLMRENTALSQKRKSARSIIDKNAESVKEYNSLDKQIKELEAKRGQISAIQAAKDQMKKSAEQKTVLDNLTLNKMGKSDTEAANLQVARLQGNQDQIRELTLINELKQKGIITDEKDIERIRQKYDELLKIRKINEETVNQAKVDKMAGDTKTQNEIAQAQLKGDYDRANMLKLINELKAQGINIDEKELQNNKAKYQALLDQRKLQKELTLKQSLQDQGHALLNQAMKQAGFSKQAAQMEAIRNAEKLKGSKLTQIELDTVKKLSDLQQELNDPLNKLNLNGLEIKTNELTARGGFSTGAVVPPKDAVNQQIRDFAQRQVQILNNIYNTLKNGGVI